MVVDEMVLVGAGDVMCTCDGWYGGWYGGVVGMW
jgi:hypothetical protein